MIDALSNQVPAILVGAVWHRAAELIEYWVLVQFSSSYEGKLYPSCTLLKGFGTDALDFGAHLPARQHATSSGSGYREIEARLFADLADVRMLGSCGTEPLLSLQAGTAPGSTEEFTAHVPQFQSLRSMVASGSMSAGARRSRPTQNCGRSVAQGRQRGPPPRLATGAGRPCECHPSTRLPSTCVPPTTSGASRPWSSLSGDLRHNTPPVLLRSSRWWQACGAAAVTGRPRPPSAPRDASGCSGCRGRTGARDGRGGPARPLARPRIGPPSATRRPALHGYPAGGSGYGQLDARLSLLLSLLSLDHHPSVAFSTMNTREMTTCTVYRIG